MQIQTLFEEISSDMVHPGFSLLQKARSLKKGDLKPDEEGLFLQIYNHYVLCNTTATCVSRAPWVLELIKFLKGTIPPKVTAAIPKSENTIKKTLHLELPASISEQSPDHTESHDIPEELPREIKREVKFNLRKLLKRTQVGQYKLEINNHSNINDKQVSELLAELSLDEEIRPQLSSIKINNLSLKSSFFYNLNTFKNLRELFLKNIQKSSEALKIDGLKGNQSLETVVISNAPISNIDSFRGNRTIRRIILDRTSIYSTEAFMNHPSLEEITIKHSSWLRNIHGLQSCPALKRITLEDITSRSICLKGALKNTKSVKELILNNLMALSDLDILEKNQSIQTLYLKNNKNLRSIGELEENSTLKILDLEHCNRLKSLVGLHKNRSLKELRVKNCNSEIDTIPLLHTPVEKSCFENSDPDLAGFQENTTIRELILKSTRLEHLDGLNLNHSLKKLILTDAKYLKSIHLGLANSKEIETLVITNSQIDQIDCLKDSHSLRYLILDGAPLSDATIAILKDRKDLVLSIQNTSITTFAFMENNWNLTKLYIANCDNISPKVLRRKYPDIEIITEQTRPNEIVTL